jgi:hypothetical protein
MSRTLKPPPSEIDAIDRSTSARVAEAVAEASSQSRVEAISPTRIPAPLIAARSASQKSCTTKNPGRG